MTAYFDPDKYPYGAVEVQPQMTYDYSLFERDVRNRQTDLKAHPKLGASMKKYGFLDCCPIVVWRRVDVENGFIILDGQHRFEFAVELKLPVWYLEVETKYKNLFPWTGERFLGSLDD
jgi:hypothetical protein